MCEPQSVISKASGLSRVDQIRSTTIRVTNILIMEDESGVKAPVTRLRRRLSVEQSDDGKSSSAPNTPTKKRAGRRVAKPDLDLINENAPESDTTKEIIKKSNMKELEVEEKSVTPSRRSARIKSNTSIVLESTQTIDSPRAKRASRRNSQVGSDNEAPLTPVRLTRRTRKDSVNADKVELGNKPAVPVTEIIVEEPEASLQKSESDSEKPIEESQSPSGLRKSPRLNMKKNKKGDSIDVNEKEKDKPENRKNDKNRESIEFNEKDKSEDYNNSNKENEVSEDKETPENVLPLIKLVDISSSLIDIQNNRLSISNIDMLNKLNTDPKKKSSYLNKSSSALIDTQTQMLKYKRHRTKSWTALSDSVQYDNKCYSDSESTMNSKEILNNSNVQDVLKNIKDNLNLSTNKNKKRDQNECIKEIEKDLVNAPKSKEKLLSPLTNDSNNSSNTNLFDKEPTQGLQTLIFIEESDSNSEKANNKDKDEDQQVPLLQSNFSKQEITPKKEDNPNTLNCSQHNEENVTVNKNDSCEPMDIDETIPDNIISNKSLLKKIDMSENKLSSQGDEEMICSDNGKDKSRKSSLTLNTSKTLDKTANENKSTLVLSQLKDISNENNVSQSPHINAEKKLSNSDQTPIYLTSTPLQQRSLLKYDVQVNTSGIITNNTSKIDKSYSKIHVSNTNKSNNKSEESESAEESLQEESDFIDGEAEDANDDYESGDSRDDDEKQYEREHEIVQKGETLTSEDELSNDSDYEKDSFVVSSDPEDDELLHGSSDDLAMSDNELKMTAKSKKKYNERMKKEQKRVSREMFASRHKLNVTNKSDKSDLTKLKQNRKILDSSDSEDENIQVKVKKNKRMRLDSGQDSNMEQILENSSKIQLNKSLPKSVHNENDTDEVEMTIIEDFIKDDVDPLSINIKKEPKTSQKEYDNNKSQLNVTLPGDPSENSNTSDSSDSSNNEHIQNYDSVLNDLNKSMKTIKNKSGDISLNINRKPKQKSIPIVDQLNLTQIKLKKKNQNELTEANSNILLNNKSMKDFTNKHSMNKSSEDQRALKNSNKSLNNISKKSVSQKQSNIETTDESSSSIDLHLLFSEDSNNSEDVEIKDKKGEQSNEDDSFIPLKKSQGKTDIFQTSGSNAKSHTESAKKIKKQNRTIDKSDVENENCDDETEVQFYLDTTGTPNSTAVDMRMSAEKKKKGEHIGVEHEDSDSDVPMEVSNRSVIETQGHWVNVQEVLNTSTSLHATSNKSKSKTPPSDKKKKITESLTKEQTDATRDQSDIDDIVTKVNQSGIAEKSINKSLSKTPRSEKEEAKRINDVQTPDQKDKNVDYDTPVENLIEAQETQTYVEEDSTTNLAAPNKSIIKTPKSDKKKKRISQAQKEEHIDATENHPNVEDIIEANVNQSGIANKSINKSVTKTPKSEKKKLKRMSESQKSVQNGEQTPHTQSHVTKNKGIIKEQAIQNNIEAQENNTGAADKSMNGSVAKTPKSDKKKKKISESQAEILMCSATNKTSVQISSSEKKKTKKILESNDANNSGNVEKRETVRSKKRKRKSSLNQTEKEPESEESVPCHTSKHITNFSISTVRLNKKRKTTENIEDSENLDQAPIQNAKMITIEKQQNKDIEKQSHPLQDTIDTTDLNLNNKKGTLKRKERENDEAIKIAKVLKVDTNDKIQVTRLPASIVNQLEDRPTKKTHQVTRLKAISTSNFVVEKNKVKKIKPSKYLEESIYLNEEEIMNSKKQTRIQNLKVLPFIPTVSTSNSGYTTNFKVNILPKQIQFVAKSTSVINYKNDYLKNKKMKRLGTYELYKRNRTIKMSKF